MSRPGRRGAARLAPLLAAIACLAGASAAPALEPRFDHRDQQGVVAEFGYARDALVVGGLSHPSDRPFLRLAWSRDVSGEGDELQLGGTARLSSWSDPLRQKSLVGIDARYRAYFGTEELKTFVEVGLWADLISRVAGGGLAGLGLHYDPSRAWGFYLAARFRGGLGQARITSVELAPGFQLRW